MTGNRAVSGRGLSNAAKGSAAAHRRSWAPVRITHWRKSPQQRKSLVQVALGLGALAVAAAWAPSLVNSQSTLESTAPVDATSPLSTGPLPDDPLFDDWRDDWIDPSTTEIQPPLESRFAFDLADGLRFRGPDGVPRLHLGGRLEIAGLLRDRRNQRGSEVRFENGEIRLDGEALDKVWLTVVADLDGRETRDGLRSAVFATQVHKFLRLSVGLQGAPIGIESSFDRDTLSFSDFAFSSWLTERTDLSGRIDGEVLDGFLSYDASYSLGEGFDHAGERLDDPRASARVVLYPLTAGFLIPPIEGDAKSLHGIFFSAGFAAEEGVHRALAVESSLHDRLFETEKLSAGAAHWWNLGYGIDAGPVRFSHEWTFGGVEDLRVGGMKLDLRDQLTAMSATLAVRIHGPDFDSHPSRQRPVRRVESWAPQNESPLVPPFEFPGAVELAVRYANGDIDRRLFDLGLADFAVSSQEFRTVTGSIGLRPSPNLRLLFEATRVIADQRPAAFDSHGRDTSFSLRAIFDF